MPETIFTKIINKELPAQFIYEDDVCVAIMDKFPWVKGQTLVIPKKEIDYAFDLDDKTYEHIFNVAKKISLASDKALNAVRSCIIVEGFDVPHVHIKIFPMQSTEKGLGAYLTQAEESSNEELAIVATEIQAALAN